MTEPTELHIILREIEDERFPGVKGVEISISPDREGIALEDLSRVEITAMQMVQLFSRYQVAMGTARQFVNGEELGENGTMALRESGAEFEWPEGIEV